MLWASALFALVLVLWALPKKQLLGVTPLAGVVAAYVAWLVADDFFNSPYTSAAIYDPAFLALGFVFARTAEAKQRASAVRVVLISASALACWSLWQAASEGMRAHAYFETPNTLATVINMVLAPLLVTIAFGEARRPVLGLAALLVAALVATLSRGGFCALAAAAVAAAFLARLQSLPVRGGDLRRVFYVLGSGVLAGVLAFELPRWLLASSGAELPDLSDTLHGTVVARFELWRLAISALGRHPWLGIGYLGFSDLFQAQHARVPSYASENFTYFVHNDYLQVLLELGLPALAARLAIVLLPYYLARNPIGGQHERVRLVAALAGLTTMAVHAVADFPFYIPLCLLLFGCLLGDVDRLVATTERQTARLRVPRVAKICVAALLAVLFLPPAMAEAVVAYGDRSWRAGQAQSAAFAFELARRLQPRDWRYHWYAGQFWFRQAAQSGSQPAARQADAAFAAAVLADPHEPRPLLARLGTQLKFGPMLEHREPPATLRGWADHALALAPMHPGIRRDYDAALASLRESR